MSAPPDVLARLLDDIARGCRSGRSLRHAVVEAAPTGHAPLDEALAAARVALGAGAPLGAAEAVFAADPTVAAAWALARSGAADPAAAFTGAATTLYERHHLAAEIRALTAGPRWSAALIAALPLLFGLWAALADPRVLAVLVGEPVGRLCLVVAVTLDGVGAWWMRRLIRRLR